jgi:hypothetical protein
MQPAMRLSDSNQRAGVVQLLQLQAADRREGVAGSKVACLCWGRGPEADAGQLLLLRSMPCVEGGRGAPSQLLSQQLLAVVC